jgi:hypothetical protein
MGLGDFTQPSIIDQLRQRKTYLKTTEVMTIFGVTRATLYGWVRSGAIDPVSGVSEEGATAMRLCRYSWIT